MNLSNSHTQNTNYTMNLSNSIYAKAQTIHESIKFHLRKTQHIL